MESRAMTMIVALGTEVRDGAERGLGLSGGFSVL